MKKPVTPRGKWSSEVDTSVCAGARHLRRKREFLQNIKMERGCEGDNCRWDGEFTPEMLAFDHKDPSTKHSRLGRNVGFPALNWDDLIVEISLCRVVCHNCHSKHTVEKGHHRPKRKEE